MSFEKIGKYQLISELGRGGMARVYLAEHPRLQRRVAIKVIREELAQEAEFLARFQEEAQSVAALHHPHIMQIYDFDITDEQQAYMVMEFVDGYSLRDMIWQRPLHFSLEESLQIVADIGQALGYAHGLGIVHRDVKPANVLVAQNGRIVLADFGLAQLLAQDRSHEVGAVRGTPTYMAPEQGKGEVVDGRADLYALGVILFELVTGQLPFRGTSNAQLIARHINTPPPHPQELNPRVPPWVAQLILRCLAKNPADRFATADELLANFPAGATKPLANVYSAPSPPQSNPLDATISGAHLQDQTTTGEEPVSYPELMAEVRRLQAELSQISANGISRPQILPPPFQAPPLLPQFVLHPTSLAQFVEQVWHGPGRIWGVHGLAAVGKTSAVAYVAHQLKPHLADGVLWVNLSTGTPESGLVSIAAAFGQTEAISQMPDLAAKADFVRQLLANKQILLVLDQVEESEPLPWLLPNGADNRVVVATRNLKLLQNLGAEMMEIVPFGPPQTHLFLSHVLGEARVLAEATAVAHLHQLVGGLPLALSIVAGYLQESEELTFAEYNGILQDEQTRLDNLTDWEDDNRNVSASFELSYRSLPAPIQEVLQVLALFEGGVFTSEAVAAVVNQPLPKVKMALGRLYTLSLIGKNKQEQYTINPLLRLFASQKLGGQRPSYTARFVAYYTAFSQQNQGMDEFKQLDGEWLNVRAALHMANGSEDKTAVVHLCLALTHQALGVMGYWGGRGLWGEARHWLAQATTVAAVHFSPEVQAILLTRWGSFAARQGEVEEALALLQRAQAAWAAVDPTASLAFGRWHQAFTYDALAQALLQRDRHEALRALEKASEMLTAATTAEATPELGYVQIQQAEIVARLGQFDVAITRLHHALSQLPHFPTSAKAKAYSLLGVIALMQGEMPQSRQYFNQALAVADILGDVHRLAILWLNKGHLEQKAGQLRLAHQFFSKALLLFEQMGDSHHTSGTRLNLGQLQRMLGDATAAQAQFEAAWQLAQQKQLLEVEALACSNLAEMAVLTGDVSAAETHLARAQVVCEQLNLFSLRPTLARTAAEVTLRGGAATAALAQMEHALQLATNSHDTAEQGAIWRLKGQALAHLHHIDQALEAYEQALDLLADNPYESALTQQLLADHNEQNSLMDEQSIRQLRQQAAHTLQQLRG
jgi:serine/threonine protein kinase/tetratricopeptide (TPR) repeat protein